MAQKRVLTAVLVLVCLLARGTAVPGRELLRQSFSGEGWNESRSVPATPVEVDFSGVSRGAISFDLQRTGDIPA